jgi:hypothetical protein
MSVAALFTWMITILAGLILVVIWIIEHDPEFQTAAATRLPVPVISAHACQPGCGAAERSRRVTIRVVLEPWDLSPSGGCHGCVRE